MTRDLCSSRPAVWIPEALSEKLKILLRTSRLIELILDCFEPQFNHTVFIFHTLKWDLLNLRSFVGEAENIKDFLSDLSYSGLFQWSSVIHTVCIYHTVALIRDLLNSKSFVGDTENVIKEFLSDWAFFWSST